jgi:hypothetical protein
MAERIFHYTWILLLINLIISRRAWLCAAFNQASRLRELETSTAIIALPQGYTAWKFDWPIPLVANVSRLEAGMQV